MRKLGSTASKDKEDMGNCRFYKYQTARGVGVTDTLWWISFVVI